MLAATAHVQLFHGHLFKRKYFSTSGGRARAAVHVSTSHEHLLAAYFNAPRNHPTRPRRPSSSPTGIRSRAPTGASQVVTAAAAHTLASHGQPFLRAHCNNPRSDDGSHPELLLRGLELEPLLAKNSPTLVFVLESITRSSLSSFGTTRSRNTSRAWYMSPKR